MADKDERARRDRLRRNLQQFYNVEAAPQPAVAPVPAVAAPTAPLVDTGRQPGGPLDIDSPHFDSTRYTTLLLRQHSLPGLVEQDNALRRQVRGLDKELRELVYNNYTQFIAAADTIKQVRGNVAEMDTRLDALRDNVTTMDTLSHKITGAVESQRAKVQGMLSANAMLRKIQFLVQLPDAMSQAAADGKLRLAARYWAAGDAVFQRYHNIQSFLGTHRQSRAQAETLYRELSAALLAAELDTEEGIARAREVAEAMRMMCATSIDLSKLQADAVVGPMAAAAAADGKQPGEADIPPGDFEGAVCSALCAQARDLFTAAADAALEAITVDAKARVEDLAVYWRPAGTSIAGDLELATDRGVPELLLAVEAHGSGTPALQQLRAAADSLRKRCAAAYDVAGSIETDAAHAVVVAAVEPVLRRAQGVLADATQHYLEALIRTGCVVAGRSALGGDAKVLEGQVGQVVMLLSTRVVSAVMEVSQALPPIAASFLNSRGADHTAPFLKQGAEHGAEATGRVLSVLQAFTDPLNAFPAGVEAALLHAMKAHQKRGPTNGAADPADHHRHATLLLPQVRALLVAAAVARCLARDPPGGDTGLSMRFEEASKGCAGAFVRSVGLLLDTAARNGLVHSVPPAASLGPETVAPSMAVTAQCWDDTRLWAGAALSAAPAPREAASSSARRGPGSAAGASRVSGDSHSRSGGGSAKVPVVARYARSGGGLGTDVDRLFAKAQPTPALRPKNLDAVHVTECCIVAGILALTDAVREVPSLGAECSLPLLGLHGPSRALAFFAADGSVRQASSVAPTLRHRSRGPFGKAELQQAQVGCSFLLQALAARPGRWCSKEDRVVAPLHELLCSVYDNAAERVPLPPAEVETVARKALRDADGTPPAAAAAALASAHVDPAV